MELAEVKVVLYTGDAVDALTEIASSIKTLIEKVSAMSDAITSLEAAQAKSDAANDAALKAMSDGVAFIATVAEKIKTAGVDPAKLQAVTTDLNTRADAIKTASDAFTKALTDVKGAQPLQNPTPAPTPTPAPSGPVEGKPTPDAASDNPPPAKVV